jgi:hypothetical protein
MYDYLELQTEASWATQTNIGMEYGVSAIRIGNELKKLGLKHGNEATKLAIKGGFATPYHMNGGVSFYLWNKNKVMALLDATFKTP